MNKEPLKQALKDRLRKAEADLRHAEYILKKESKRVRHLESQIIKLNARQ